MEWSSLDPIPHDRLPYFARNGTVIVGGRQESRAKANERTERNSVAVRRHTRAGRNLSGVSIMGRT